MDLPKTVLHNYGWSPCTSEDLKILEQQLGRRPRTVLAVARRCRYGVPQVIVNDPLPVDKDGFSRPFPTLFWLTCPHLVREVGRLEAKGWVAALREELQAHGEFDAMARAHEDYAALRLQLCDKEEVEALRLRAPKQYETLARSGVGGIVALDGVKCLHTHLADYLGRQTRAEENSSVNWVGQKTTELLLETGVDLDGAPTCDGCPAQGCKGEQMIAAIEVGSHAARMVVYGRGAVIERQRAVTRLGEGVGPDGALTDVARDRTIQALKNFAEVCRRYGAVVVAGATAAVRRAGNGGAFLRQVWEETGLSVPVLSESEEAQLSFWGATLGTTSTFGTSMDGNKATLCVVIDVGGGSTEIALGSGDGELIDSVSVPLGAVVATERFFTNDPPTPEELIRLKTEVRQQLESQRFLDEMSRDHKSLVFIAVGGTASSALAMKHGIPESSLTSIDEPDLGRDELSSLIDKLSSISADQRVHIPGLAAERADAIVAGLVILHEVMDSIGASSLMVSQSDILQGLLHRTFLQF